MRRDVPTWRPGGGSLRRDEGDDRDEEYARVPVIRMSEDGPGTSEAPGPPEPIDEPLLGDGGKKVLAGVLLAVAAFLLVRTGAWIYYELRIERAARRLEARIGSMDPASLNTPPVPDAENPVVRLKQLLPLACGATSEALAVARLLDSPESAREEVQRILVERREALRGIEEALGAPGTPRRKSAWGVDYTLGYRAALPSPSQLVTAGRLLVAEALTGDEGRILPALTACLRLAATLENDRVLVLQGVRSELERRALVALRLALAEGRLDAGSLTLLAAELPAPAGLGVPVPGLDGEIKLFHSLFQARVAYGLRPSRWLVLPLYQRTHLRWLEYFDACYDVLAQPRGSRPRFPLTPASYYTLARPVSFSTHIVELGTRADARRQLARAAVAAALTLARSTDGWPAGTEAEGGVLVTTSGDRVVLSVPGLALPSGLRRDFEWTVVSPPKL